MKQYIVKSGQNLFDIALTLYGGLEGVLDLLARNDGISYSTQFVAGDKLNYSEEFKINGDLVSWFSRKGITVKNGYHLLPETDIMNVFKSYILASNHAVSAMFNNGSLSIDYEDNGSPLVPRPRRFFNRGVSNVPKRDGYGLTYPFVSDDILYRGDLQESIKSAINVTVDINRLTSVKLTSNLVNMFRAGMILLPAYDIDSKAFYDALISPKIFIKQYGISSAINVVLATNKMLLIDWGDDGDYEFCHFIGGLQKISHLYNDTGEHIIKIYGTNSFVYLDMTEVNGRYLALENIFIDDAFITPYASDKTINKLFIIKD